MTPGSRYKGMNGACTHIGNTDFAWFATTRAKSRLNFLALLRAGATDYVINDEALAYMRGRSLSGLVIARLAGHKSKRLKDQEAWMAHLERLGITRLRVHPDPLKIATEGALWGSVVAHGSQGCRHRQRRRQPVQRRLSRAVLGPRRAAHPQAGRLQPPPAAGVCADPGAGGVVLRRPEGILPRSHSAPESGSFRPALTGCSPPPPALPPSTGCSPGSTPTRSSCSAPSNGRISRFTPTARRMTSAAR